MEEYFTPGMKVFPTKLFTFKQITELPIDNYMDYFTPVTIIQSFFLSLFSPRAAGILSRVRSRSNSTSAPNK